MSNKLNASQEGSIIQIIEEKDLLSDLMNRLKFDFDLVKFSFGYEITLKVTFDAKVLFEKGLYFDR